MKPTVSFAADLCLQYREMQKQQQPFLGVVGLGWPFGFLISHIISVCCFILQLVFQILNLIEDSPTLEILPKVILGLGKLNSYSPIQKYPEPIHQPNCKSSIHSFHKIFGIQGSTYVMVYDIIPIKTVFSYFIPKKKYPKQPTTRGPKRGLTSDSPRLLDPGRSLCGLTCMHRHFSLLSHRCRTGLVRFAARGSIWKIHEPKKVIPYVYIMYKMKCPVIYMYIYIYVFPLYLCTCI